LIYPTGRAVALAALGAPAALLIGVWRPHLWIVALIWLAIVGVLIAFDTLSALRAGGIIFQLSAPRMASVGRAVRLRLGLAGGLAAVASGEAVLDVDERLDPSGRIAAPLEAVDEGAKAEFEVKPGRRGPAPIATASARWKGPLGLVWRQQTTRLDRDLAVVTDTRPVRDEGVRLFMRDALHGLMARLDRGEGSEFESLADYLPGMDRRGIDWKQSARHMRLLAKEFRTERNNEIVFAVDCGRAMCEPVAGVPRVDRAVSAALLAAYIALKVGDRVRLLSFAARPHLMSAALSGARSFVSLQQLAARIDYAPEETNYTLALSTLGAALQRRSLIIVFTDFTDPTGAELMVRAAGRLLDRHVVLFVVMQDAELEAFAAKEPEEVADVSRAITAAAMLRERRIVTTRLKRLGVHVIEAPYERIGVRLVDGYLAIKRRNLL